MQLLNPIKHIEVDRRVNHDVITRLHDGARHLNVADTYIGAEDELALINRPLPTILGKLCKVSGEVVGLTHVASIRVTYEVNQYFANRLS